MGALVADKFLKCLSDNIDDYPEGIVIPVDKPYRWTSADVIRKLKFAACRHFHKKNLKVGHAGTLDPLATGVLLVCIGKACRLAEEFQKRDKEYVAGVAFGATTPSYDLEKEIDRFYPSDGVTEEALRGILPSFLGEQEQVAPLFSAKSVDGVRAYELARREYRRSIAEGKDFAHEAASLLSRQRVNISSIELVSFHPGSLSDAARGALAGDRIPGGGADSYSEVAAASSLEISGVSGSVAGFSPEVDVVSSVGGEQTTSSVAAGRPSAGVEVPADNARNARIHVTDNSALGLPRADIRVSCSKGTYIRALARDLGEALSSGAHLDALRRTRNGGFDVSDALTVEEALALLGQR